jgi:hypothetical protein
MKVLFLFNLCVGYSVKVEVMLEFHLEVVCKLEWFELLQGRD